MAQPSSVGGVCDPVAYVAWVADHDFSFISVGFQSHTPEEVC
jgi:hypothetical protein